jgi:hypothetical protein
MNYTKPEIVATADAVSVIQSMAKVAGPEDSTIHRPSTAAYEADE